MPLHITPMATIKKLNAVATWSWNTQAEICSICRNNLCDICIECQVEAKENCPIAWGRCNHAFHQHCISRWLITRSACPLDNSDWVFQKTE